MNDEQFNDAFTLHIPPAYNTEDTQKNKIIFALASLGEGTVNEVVAKLEDLEPGITSEQLTAMTNIVLKELYDKGLIKGSETNGEMHYDTSKMLKPNEGAVNVGLLDPDKDR